MAVSMFRWLGSKVKSASLLFRRKIFVFGDSHTEVFQHLNAESFARKFYFVVCLIGGATAQGLRNPNSKTNALEIFRKRIEKIKNKSHWIVFMLGEVDTGFVIWFRSEKYNDSVENQMQESLEAYFSFLQWTKARGHANIAVLSSPPPTIEDNQDWGTVANLRREVKATKIDRTKLNCAYNFRLAEFCKTNGITFLDCDPYLLAENGLIRSEYLNSDKTNHHLNVVNYSKIIYNVLLNGLKEKAANN